MAETQNRLREMDPKNFFAELKRRNVYKVVVASASPGWDPLRRDARFQELCDGKQP